MFGILKRLTARKRSYEHDLHPSEREGLPKATSAEDEDDEASLDDKPRAVHYIPFPRV